jgi:hypothetical protein
MTCFAVSVFPMSALGDTPANGKRIEAGGLSFGVPQIWVEEQPSGEMRKAQLKSPATAPDTESASLVVYYFGPNQGGSIEANLTRWEEQFEVPSDIAPADAKKVATRTVAGMNVTTLEMAGTYVAPLSPRMPNQRHNKPNYRLFAAVVTTPDGNFFFKIVGPQQTMAQSREHFGQMIASLAWQN